MESVEISPVKSFAEFVGASQLVHDQYCRIGLMEPHQSGLRLRIRDLLTCSWTLIAQQAGHIQGTATIQLLSAAGLPSANSFSGELSYLRQKSSRIAESTKFACVPNSDGPRGLGKMSRAATSMLTALYQACLSLNISDWLLVVHPRVIPLYQDTLCFQQVGAPRACSHVDDAPGVLLRLGVEALNKSALTRDAISMFLEHKTLIGFSGDSYQPDRSDITALLLDDPDMRNQASAGELHELEHQFPGLLDQLRSCLPSVELRTDKPRPYLTRRWIENFKHRDEQFQSLTPYALRRLCREVYLLLEPIAEARDIQMIWTVDDRIPDALVGYPEEIGHMLFWAIRNMLTERCTPWVSVHVSTCSTQLNLITLQATIKPQIAMRLLRRPELTSAPICEGAPYMREDGVMVWSAHVTPYALPTTISFPTSDSDQISAALPHGNMRVLVIEDSRVFQVIARRLLTAWGMDVTVAGTGEDALEALQFERFDVILLDVQLPGMSGFEVARILRKRESTCDQTRIPVIATTSFVMPEDEARCYEAGMDYYLAKPFSAHDLRQLLTRALAPVTYKQQIWA